MDGWVVIGTKMDSKELEKDLKNAERRLKQYEKESEKLTKAKTKVEVDLQPYEEQKRLIQEMTDEMNQYAQSEADVSKNLNIEKAQLEELNQKYSKQIQNLEKINTKIKENTKNQDIVKSQIEETNNKLKKIKGYKNINDITKDIDKSTSNVLKKIAKWTLAVFGVRSAYMFVRQAASTLAQYNEQIGTDLEYINFALASMLQPVIEGIISLVYKLLAYVNYLAEAWFGVSLFANATTEAFNKTNKAAKELQKTTTGFDEMNVMQSNSSDNSIKNPSNDLSKNIKDIPIPGWLKWIKDNWKIIVGGLLAIVGAVTLFALLGNKGLGKVGTSFTGFFNSLGKATEAIAILGGLTLVIQAISGLISSFAESGLSLGTVAGLLGVVLGEVAIGFTLLAAATKLMDWSGIAGAAVILGGFALVLTSVSNLLNTFAKTGTNVGDVGLLLISVFGVIVGLMTSVAVLGPLMTAGLLPFAAVMGVLMATLGVMALTLPTILDATADFIERTAPKLESILKTIGDLLVNIIYSLGTSLPPIIQSVGSLFTNIFNGVSKVINTVGNTIVNILNTAKSLVTTVLKSILDFINKLGPAINNFVDNAIQAVTKLVNFMISAIEYLVNTLIVDGVNKIIKAINSVAEYVGISIPTVPQFTIKRFVPKLAVGGIISMPGKGVPVGYGQALGGESGREGVLPLTNSQAMEELGSAIGRYITVDLTNYIELDGRKIARHQSKIQSNMNFAMNK